MEAILPLGLQSLCLSVCLPTWLSVYVSACLYSCRCTHVSVCLYSAFLAFYCFKMNRELSVMLNDSVLANLCLDTNNTVSLLYLVQNTHVSFHNLCTAVAALSLPLNPASLGDVNTARGTQGRTGEHCGRTTLLCLFEMTLFVSIALSNVPLQETSARIPLVVPRETETYP